MKQLTIQQIFQSDYGLNAPFNLTLPNLMTLNVQKVLRYLPGKRIAFKGRKNNKTLFIKIFSQSEKRNYKKELNGIERLQKVNIMIASLIENSTTKYYSIIIQEWLGEDRQDRNTPHFFKQALCLLGQLHSYNLIHIDIHLNNFHYIGDELYLLDAGSIQKQTHQNRKIQNLALFIAQFPMIDQKGITHLKQHYENRAHITLNYSVLAKKVKKFWHKRKSRYLKKIFRNCSEIKVSDNKSSWQVVNRKYYTDNLQNLLNNINNSMNQGEILKAGNSQTIVKVRIDNKDIVIKRYNQKGFWGDYRKKLFDISRAKNCWKSAHLLTMLDIKTPEPVALVENKCGMFHKISYYIYEYIEAETLIETIKKQNLNRCLLSEIQKLRTAMHTIQLSHGDFKGSNLLMKDMQLYLIDLDVMRENKWYFQYRHNKQKDKKRLLKNFSNDQLSIINLE